MLKRVSIQNFKSLKDVTLDLQKVNLLIGPNNSGKTNFLKAIQYMLKDNINQFEENFDALIFSKNNTFNLSMQFRYYDKSREDLVTVYECKVGRHKTISKTKKTFSIPIGGAVLYDDPSELNIIIGKGIIYKPDPNKLTKPGPVGMGAELVNADASNLVGFLDRMLGNKYRKTVFNRIENDLHKCISEFDQIELDDTAVTEELIRIYGEESRKNSFKRLGLIDEKKGVSYWADELSEGTLYFIALLCIINQPNPPKLLLLEEPEKGIHPRRIFEVIQFIFRLAEEKDVQVIMTTHSPIVVDMFKDMPESVFIFDKDEEGATHVKNLLRDVIEPETARSDKEGTEPPHYTDSLGDAWTVGFLGGVPK